MSIMEQIGYLDHVGRLGPPPPRYTHKLHSHSTGRDYQITAHLGDEKLVVYRVWEWYSSRYDFNDRGKAYGWQVPEDGHPALLGWLREIPSRYEAVVAEIAERTRLNALAVAEKERTKVDRFAAAFSQSGGAQ